MQMWFILLFELHREKIVPPPYVLHIKGLIVTTHTQMKDAYLLFVPVIIDTDRAVNETTSSICRCGNKRKKEKKKTKETEHICIFFLYFFFLQKEARYANTNQNCHGIIMKYNRDTCLLWNDAYWYKRKESYNFSKTHTHIHTHTMALGG